MSSIQITDTDKVLRVARALGPDAQKAANRAIMKASQYVADTARPKIPRSKKPHSRGGKNGWRTGEHVQDVLTAERATASKYITGGVTTPGGVHDGSHFYIRFLEYGRTARAGDPLKKGRKSKTSGALPRNEYITKTAASNESTIDAIIMQELKNGLGL